MREVCPGCDGAMIVAVPATDDPDDFTVELCSECGGLGTVDEEPDDLPDEEE